MLIEKNTPFWIKILILATIIALFALILNAGNE